MRNLLLLISLSLFSLAAQAQTTPSTSTPPPASLPELSAGRRDTLDAIASLHERRRRGGKVWLGIAGGGLLAVVRVVANPNTTTTNGVRTSTETNGSALATVTGLFVAFPAAIGMSKLVRFNEEKEKEADRGYRNGLPLPRSISRRLPRKASK